MNDVERMIELMSRPPEPAAEVVTLCRAVVVQLLAESEHKGPLDPVVTYLRAELAQPKVELWVSHSVGPNEVHPHLTKEAAEEDARETIKLCDAIAEREKFEDWSSPMINVIPSPWEPAEHFQYCAEDAQEQLEGLRESFEALEAKRDELLAALKAIAEFIPNTSASEGGAAKYSAHVAAADTVRATLAKFEVKS